MSKEKHIDLAENAMANARKEDDLQVEIPDNWQSDLMSAIHAEGIPEDIIFDATENKLLHFSWIAAGIAATVTVAFTLFYTPEQYEDGIDIETQLIDYSATELILDELK